MTGWISSLSTKADIPLLMKYFTRFPSRSCDFSIGGTLMWSDFYGYRYAVCGDTLFIKGYDPIAGRNIYYQPSGCLPQEIWMRLIREDCRNSPDSCALIPLESETSIDEETTDSFDMSLRNISIRLNDSCISRKKNGKKRNHLNYFINNYDNLSIESLSKQICGRFPILRRNSCRSMTILNYVCMRTVRH